MSYMSQLLGKAKSFLGGRKSAAYMDIEKKIAESERSIAESEAEIKRANDSFNSPIEGPGASTPPPTRAQQASAEIREGLSTAEIDDMNALEQEILQRHARGTEEVVPARKPNKKERRQQARAEKFGPPKQQAAPSLEEDEIPIEMADEIEDGEGIQTLKWADEFDEEIPIEMGDEVAESAAREEDEIGEMADDEFADSEQLQDEIGEMADDEFADSEQLQDEIGEMADDEFADSEQLQDEIGEVDDDYFNNSEELYEPPSANSGPDQYGFDEFDPEPQSGTPDFESGQQANKSAREEFLKDSKAGTSLKSHALDYLIAPTVGAAVAGTQKALEYDNETDKELKGLPLTGRANAFIKGATEGAAVGLGGVAATKGMQSGLARSVGSRSKSLTSSFLMGLDVAPKSGKWSDWAQRSASKTRAVSESVNKAELRGSMETAEEAMETIGGVEEQLKKEKVGMTGQQAKEYYEESYSRMKAAAASGDKEQIAAQEKFLREGAPHEKKARAAGAKISKAEQKINSARESFQTYAPANADKEGALNGSARKAISEMPNLGAFYMGQLTAGVDASLSVGKKFYSENVAPPPKEGSSSFFKRRNPGYLSAGEEGTGKAVDEYYGPKVSGAISGAHALGGLGIAAGAIGVAAGTGASSSASGGGFSHPMNVLTDSKSRYMSAQAQMQGDASERVRMTNPGAIGLNDIEENYFTNPSMSPKRGRHTPGKYNDTGNLTLALSTLRRG
jgi:hypothetical protein